jgi:hypothetical protein
MFDEDNPEEEKFRNHQNSSRSRRWVKDKEYKQTQELK